MYILFYSEHCNHCNMLLETLKTHDSQHIVKRISVDVMKSQNMKIDPLINRVPAMLIAHQKTSNKYIFGKEVFDYLLLPGQGILLNSNNNNNNNNSSSNGNVIDEPNGMESFISQSFESLEDTNTAIGPVTVWETLEHNDIKTPTEKPIQNSDTDKSHKTLPSLDDIRRMRETDLK